MALYQIFQFRNGELVGEVKRQCADDLDALDAARALCMEFAVEVYTGLRLVARIKKGDAPLAAKDANSG